MEGWFTALGGLPACLLGFFSWVDIFREGESQWLFLCPLIGGRWYIIIQLAVFTTYIPLIYCQLGDYMLPTTYLRYVREPGNSIAKGLFFCLQSYSPWIEQPAKAYETRLFGPQKGNVLMWFSCISITFPETNIAPENWQNPKRIYHLSQPWIFSGK